jgi:hypothetical protein
VPLAAAGGLSGVGNAAGNDLALLDHGEPLAVTYGNQNACNNIDVKRLWNIFAQLT